MTTASELLSSETCIDLSNVFAVEFQLERTQFLRLDICDLLAQKEAPNAGVNSQGYCVFSVSELVCACGGRIERKVINDETGEQIAQALITCTLRPKPHAVMLQFAASNLYRKGANGNTTPTQGAKVFFEIHRMPSDDIQLLDQQQLQQAIAEYCNGTPNAAAEECCSPKGSLLYRSENVKWNSPSSRLLWRTFTLLSTDIARRELRLLCFQRDNSRTPALPPMPLGEFPMHFSVLRRGPGPENVYFLVYEDHRHRKKTAGTFELCRLHEVCIPSFLEYIAAGSALNLTFAVDFSRPETTVEESQVRRYVDDVELAIAAFGEPLRDFNSANSYAAFGLGAKIPPHFRESQEFCLNLDMGPWCSGLDGVLNAFKTSFVNVQPLNQAHLSHVIYYVAKLAQNSLGRISNAIGGASIETDYNPPAYFVLVLITRGVFDDLKETVQAIIFASRAPVSIIFVGIGEDVNELAELERLATAGKQLNFHGRKPERDCTQYVSLPGCRAEEAKLTDLKALIAERGLGTLAQQFCTWMSRNGYQKAPAEYLDSPSSTPNHRQATGSRRQHLPPFPSSPPALPPTRPPLLPHHQHSSAGVHSISTGSLANPPMASPRRALPSQIQRSLDGRISTTTVMERAIGGTQRVPFNLLPTSNTAITPGSSFCSSTASPSRNGSSSSTTKGAQIHKRFCNLELNNLAFSLPGSPRRRRRLPSTALAMEQSKSGQNRRNFVSLNTAGSPSKNVMARQQQQFAGTRSLSMAVDRVGGCREAAIVENGNREKK